MGSSSCTCKETVWENKNEIDGRASIQCPDIKASVSTASMVNPEASLQPPRTEFAASVSSYAEENKEIHSNGIVRVNEETDTKRQFADFQAKEHVKEEDKNAEIIEDQQSPQILFKDNPQFEDANDEGKLSQEEPAENLESEKDAEPEAQNNNSLEEEKGAGGAMAMIEEAEAEKGPEKSPENAENMDVPENPQPDEIPDRGYQSPQFKFVDSVPLHSIDHGD